jgi:hypothetical protein
MSTKSTDKQADAIADAIESLSFHVSEVAGNLDALGYNSGDRRSGIGALEGVAIAIAGEGLRSPLGTSLESIASEMSAHTEAVESVAYQIGRIATALETLVKQREQ